MVSILNPLRILAAVAFPVRMAGLNHFCRQNGVERIAELRFIAFATSVTRAPNSIISLAIALGSAG